MIIFNDITYQYHYIRYSEALAEGIVANFLSIIIALVNFIWLEANDAKISTIEQKWTRTRRIAIAIILINSFSQSNIDTHRCRNSYIQRASWTHYRYDIFLSSLLSSVALNLILYFIHTKPSEYQRSIRTIRQHQQRIRIQHWVSSVICICIYWTYIS